MRYAGMARRLRRAAAGAAALVAALSGTSALANDPVQLAQGKKLFTSADPPCALCHTLKDAGTNGQVGPPLDDLKPSAEMVLTALREGVGVMPSYREKLSEAQRLALARYVSKVTGGGN